MNSFSATNKKTTWKLQENKLNLPITFRSGRASTTFSFVTFNTKTATSQMDMASIILMSICIFKKESTYSFVFKTHFDKMN
jgi:uncharacterized beta-barrel protein YwiB (DUF1934 family)